MNNVTSRNLPAELRVSGRVTKNADISPQRQKIKNIAIIMAIIETIVFGGVGLRLLCVVDPANPGGWILLVIFGGAVLGAFMHNAYQYFSD